MKKEYTCIICPASCVITVTSRGRRIISLRGAKCQKGIAYIKGELIHPRRVLTTTVEVRKGRIDLVSVRTRSAIPRSKLIPAMNILARRAVTAPVKIGDIIVKNVANTGVDVIATKSVYKA
ncbi:MAG: DUF1667 domain-containing protein [Candidatus Omnitrophica bacterium]|nr:DUF1667 domain-containing protein [Candidatus Omnitrophota bacterium]